MQGSHLNNKAEVVVGGLGKESRFYAGPRPMGGTSPTAPPLAGGGESRARIQGLEDSVQGSSKTRGGLPRPPVWVPALSQFCVLRSPCTCLGETVTGGKA